APRPPAGRSTAAPRAGGGAPPRAACASSSGRGRAWSMERWLFRSAVGSCEWPLSDYGFRCRACTGLDGALSLAAFDLEGSAAVPVDELVHGLQTKIDGHRQILDDALQLGRAHALGEGAEALSRAVPRLVVADPALDRLGHALGRQPQLQAFAE